MFKYYILGSMSYPGVLNVTGNTVNFTMESRKVAHAGVDLHNFPSTCIHFAGTTDICRRYEIPGLPRFENTNLPGVDQTMNNFIDSIVTKKAEDCSERTQLNFLTLANWVYGVKDDTEKTLADMAPAVASEFPGSWPKAFELAIRIRNLEYIMNTTNFNGVDFNRGVCSKIGSSQGLACRTEVEQLTSARQPHYERTVKAFFSAFRNLGNEDDDEMKGSFVLTEITPNSFTESSELGLSNILIPQQDQRRKTYLDLKYIPLNFVNFYTALITMDEKDLKAKGVTGATTGEAGCGATKVGMPVPGYPFGFVKNPNVLTYYAVKGEANFIGLFNPFQTNYTKLTAYAAAKPFGGRIGPHLFNLKDPNLVKGRTLPPKTAAYMAGLRIGSNDRFKPGTPIPQTERFWISNPADAIGGWLSEGEIRFGLPNMIYENVGDMSKHAGSEAIMSIEPGQVTDGPGLGLFDPAQFNEFKKNFPAFDGNTQITAEHIYDAILNVRAPTHYEAQNYLIPFPNELWNGSSDSFGVLAGKNDDGVWRSKIFAPLFSKFGDGQYLFSEAGNLKNMLETYIKSQEPSVMSYVESLRAVANNMRSQESGQGLYFNAAKIIHDGFQGAPLTCTSMAGKFLYYFMGGLSNMGNTQGCPKPFSESLIESWFNNQTNIDYANYYEMVFKYRDADSSGPNKYFSAYAPGPFNRASPDAVVSNPFLGGSEKMLRNFYSTKFVSLKSLTQNGEFNESSKGFAVVSEGRSTVTDDTRQQQFENYINPASVGIDISTIYH
jgi:hypothetical protein